jgi:ribosomal protein S18 acetylase RimI-like enzyme
VDNTTSMYADYLMEHRGDGLVSSEHGFATYRFVDASTVYIVDIYVKPEFRECNAARAIADSIVGIAKQRGCVELLGTVVPSAANSTTSLKVLIGYGMKLKSSANDLIIFTKEIK